VLDPKSTCPECKGDRYVIGSSGERSVARVCRCNQECSVCGGAGRIFVEQGGYSYAQPCTCRSIAHRVERFNQARLPARCGLSFEDFLPENPEQETAHNVAKTTAYRYRADDPSRGFVVAGPVGSGKTHLLCATLRHLTLEMGVAARYVEVSFLFSEIRKGFSENRSGLDAILPLVHTDVLAIDELGKGRGSPFELDTLDELIARRYNANRTTLFATNCILDEAERGGYVEHNERTVAKEQPSELLLRNRVGERIWSRLHEMCHRFQLPLGTPDHRRKSTAAR
jgi:DNA replication protein DnaC